VRFICPKCKGEFFDRVKYCPECGFDFTAGLRRCPRCRSQVPVDSKTCPECQLNFEQWELLLPRLIILGAVGLIVIFVGVFPFIWKVTPWLHDKGVTVEGKLMSEVEGMAMVPLFIHWKTGERYIKVSAEKSGYGESTDYMNKLIPLPPQVVFHYDMPLGEKVWIIRRVRGSDDNEWVQIGRWIESDKPWKYGWIHASNLKVIE